MNSTTSFENTELAFAYKKDRELRKSIRLFRFLSRPMIIRASTKLTTAALKFKLPVTGIIRNTVFREFCAGETLEESKSTIEKLGKQNIGSILDFSIEGKCEKEDFECTKDEVIRILGMAHNDPNIPYACLKMSGIAPYYLLEKITLKKSMNRNDREEYDEVLQRLSKICSAAEALQVPIYIDAEESWMQGAIDQLTEVMMQKHNRKSAVVNTTLQMYRRDRLEYLDHLIEWGAREQLFIGVKLVRGAYLEKENVRAKEKNQVSPIFPDKSATDEAFNAAIDKCLHHLDRVVLCAGTHNEESTYHLLNRMKEFGIQNDHPHVFQSQLFGMSDHISFNLAASGYRVTKYLPYGPIQSVLPYLIRRAEENSAITGQMGRELKLLDAEQRRRRECQLLIEQTRPVFEN